MAGSAGQRVVRAGAAALPRPGGAIWEEAPFRDVPGPYWTSLVLD